MDSGTLADRRAALTELRALLGSAPQAQVAVGRMGLHVLLAVLREDHDDVELVRGALEALLQTVTVGSDAERDPGALNAELLCRDARSLPLVLQLLEDDDFYVRLHALQLLCGILASKEHAVHAAVLASPLGVLRLLDLTTDVDAVRNEALLLLNSLLARPSCHEEERKVLAFEGAFERLFGIVAAEGSLDGGSVVLDCLELVAKLLRLCPPNQMLFRESGLLANLHPLLALRTGASVSFSRQAAANVLGALELVLLLTQADNNPQAAANQAAMLRAGLLDPLLLLALGGHCRFPGLRNAARHSLAALIRKCAAGQEALGVAEVALDGEAQAPASALRVPALTSALQAVLQASDSFDHAAAEELIGAYCAFNPDGQRCLLSTLAPMADTSEAGSASFGALLAAGLMGSDLEKACRATDLLLHLVMENQAAQEQLLRTPLFCPSSGLPELIMPRCVHRLHETLRAGPPAVALQMALLRFLAVWLHDCPAAVSAFLSSPSNLPLLVDLTMRADADAAGFAVAILGSCVVSNTSAGDFRAPVVLDVIVSRITLAGFFRCWEALQGSESFKAAGRQLPAGMLVTRSTASALVENPAALACPCLASCVYSPEVAALLARLEQAVRSSMLTLYARPRQAVTQKSGQWDMVPHETQEEHITRLRAGLLAADEELVVLRARNGNLMQQLMTGEHDSGSGAGEPDTHIQGLLTRVREEAERDIAAARAQTAEALALARRHEENLMALSQAYNALESAHNRLEEEGGGGGSRPTTPQTQPGAALLEALEAGRAEGRSAAEEAMSAMQQELDDLLVCLVRAYACIAAVRWLVASLKLGGRLHRGSGLTRALQGQEEEKASKLAAALEERGVDTAALLASRIQTSAL